ncbi:hypothetical protein ACFL6M_07235, partial [Candidatus Eisenbacteria bacterium]
MKTPSSTCTLITLLVVLVAVSGAGVCAGGVSSHLLIAPVGSEGGGEGTFGQAIAPAGDFNGDGYDDIIAGDMSANGYTGAAYIYYGGPYADEVADVTFSPAPSTDGFGAHVGSAGDFNHDGYSDVVVAYVDIWAYESRAYIYYGGPDGNAGPDLLLEGGYYTGDFGAAIAPVGDFNADGYDDFAIGEPYSDSTGTHAGLVYLYYGGPAPDDEADLIFAPESDSTLYGFSLSGAGDFNGDGYDDFVIGGPSEGTTWSDDCVAHLYLGGPSPDNVLDSNLNEYGFDWPTYDLGYSIAGPGDLNGDGFDDIIAGAPNAWVGEDHNGGVIIYYGNPSAMGGADVVLSGEVDEEFGWQVAAAGNVNGDEYADFIVGAPRAWAGPVPMYEGEARLYLGGPSLSETPDLSLIPDWGLAYGTIASAGDFDGDGFDDLLMGHAFHAGGYGQFHVYGMQPLQVLSPSGGEAWVAGASAKIQWRGAETADLALSIDGGFTWETVAEGLGGNRDNSFTLTAPAQATEAALVAVCPHGEGPQHRFAAVSGGSFRIVEPRDPPTVTQQLQLQHLGWDSGDEFGTAVSRAGDFNGDGFEDYIIGAPNAQGGSAQSGCAHLCFGGPDAVAFPDLILTRFGTGNKFGAAVAAAGDVNGDGYDDVVVGAPEYNNRGSAFVYFGGSSPDEYPDLIFSGVEDFERFGLAVASAGDVNGDNCDDVLVGAAYSDAGGSNVGLAYVFHGGPSADSDPDWVLSGEADGDFFGWAVVGLGDVNLDGFSDVAVGARSSSANGNNAGRCFVYWGGVEPDVSPDVVLDGEAAGDHFGNSVAAGDVTGDGIPDLIVGAHEHDLPGDDIGAVYVFPGGPAMSTAYERKLHGEEPDDAFGWSVASGSDLNQDGYDDIVVSANLNDFHASDAGRAYVFFGGPGGGDAPDITFTGENSNDEFGKAVACAGDINGDGFGDVLVG